MIITVKSIDALFALWVCTLRPRRNEHFEDDICKRIFLNENVWVSIKISLKFVPKGPINNIPALFRIMAWRRAGDKPLSEPMMVSLPKHICLTRPQWVKMQSHFLTQYCVCLWSNLPQSFYDSQCIALIAVVKGEQLFESIYSDVWLQDQQIRMTCPMPDYPLIYNSMLMHAHLLPSSFNP